MSMQKHKQDGMVAMVVVSLVIIILALMTIGFAKIMDRGYRQSLDRELATQASYAAEAGINDARAYVLNANKNGTLDEADTNGECKDLSTAPAPFVRNGSLSGHYNNDSTNNLVKYTCVIIDTKPKDLIYNLHQGESRVFKVIAEPGTTLDRLYFGWTNPTHINLSTTLPSPYTLPQEGTYAADSNITGILRATIYPVPHNINSSADINKTLGEVSRTYFMYPNGGSPSNPGSSSYSNNGSIVPGNCNLANLNTTSYLPYAQATPRFCNSYVSGLSSSGASFYYVRITALYRDMNVSLQAANPGNESIRIQGAEAVVDVTGQGSDVLKRLQGRVTLNAAYNLPSYGLQSMDTLCKKFRVPKTGPVNSWGTSVIDDGPFANNQDSTCRP